MSYSSSESGGSDNDSDVHFITGYVFEVEQEGDDQHNVLEQREVTELRVDVGLTTSTASNTLISEDEVVRDIYAYGDEPIASPEWIEEYTKEIERQKNEQKELTRRLDGSEAVDSWCKCGFCNVKELRNPLECYCCQEIENCVSSLGHELVLKDVSQPPVCVTLHPGFQPVSLEKWSLMTSAGKYKSQNRRRYKMMDSENRFLRSVAYREFTYLIHSYVGGKRTPLPACAYNAIRNKFKDENEEFTRFKFDDKE